LLTGAVKVRGCIRVCTSRTALPPNAAATADVSPPVKQGLVQSLGVFIDTLVICSATAFIILFSGIYQSGEADGITLTQQAMGGHIGGWSVGFLSFAIFMFAFSSITANYNYGETNIEFIAGSKCWVFFYRKMVVGLVLFGSVAALELVWALADLFIGSMALVNLVAIAVLRDYSRQREAGQDPVFHANNAREVKNAECLGESDRVR
jgi:AGCS family alanine or glycine:cation symporter